MRHKASLFAAALALVASPILAAEQKAEKPWEKYAQPKTWVYPLTVSDGGGGKREASCATVSGDFASMFVRQWIFGFWSGLNTANKKIVGNTTDANGVVGEVKLFCDANPSATIIEATEAAYSKMSAAGR